MKQATKLVPIRLENILGESHDYGFIVTQNINSEGIELKGCHISGTLPDDGEETIYGLAPIVSIDHKEYRIDDHDEFNRQYYCNGLGNILISNVTANEISTRDELTKLLIDQIESRVRWRESVIKMTDKGVNHFIEIGPGKVLSGLVKRINKNVKINTINSDSDIKDLNL